MLHLSLRATPSPQTKVIISISKKNYKLAVTRNRVKRRIRAIMQKMTLKPAKYLIIVRSGAENIKGKELEMELNKII
ncbi:MAG TPA: ribonuclease P protein component [Candidatus Paceibacterota bacterium]